MSKAFYRAYGDVGDIRFAEWWVLEDDCRFADGSDTYKQPFPIGLTVAEDARDDYIVITPSDPEQGESRRIERCRFHNKLVQRYMEAG